MPIDLTPISSGYNLSAINDNFQKIKDEWDDKLDRLVSTQGNQMGQDFDMNGYNILNALVRGVSLDGLVNNIDEALKEFISKYTPKRKEFNTTAGQTVFDVDNITLDLVRFYANGNLADEGDYEVNVPDVGKVTWNGYAFTSGERVDIFYNELEASGVTTTSGVTFLSVADMVAGNGTGGPADFTVMSSRKDSVTTHGYFSTGVGGAKYMITTLPDYRAEIGDPTWVPDGIRDHYLLGGGVYVAVLLPELEGVVNASQYGVVYNLNTAATENVRRINAAIEFLSPFPWEGTSDDTYFQKAISGGKVMFDKGFIAVDDTILLNPRVTLEGVTPGDRLFGKKFVSAGEQATIFSYTGPESPIYVIDTANYKDAFPGTRTTDSGASFFNSSLDARTTTWSEGSFLRNLYIVNNGTGRGATGGFRLAAAMKGGYDGVSVSGFDVGCMLSNIFNWTLGSLWVEECYHDMLLFECTNLRCKGQTVLVGNTNKAVVPDEMIARIPVYYGGNFSGDDDNTLPIVHMKQSKGIFSAFCTEPVFDNLAIEFKANAICAYGNAGETFFTVRDFSEEGNAFTMDIEGNLNVKSVLVTGFNCQFRFQDMNSLSDMPFQACGTGSVIYVTGAKKWVGDSFYPDYMDNVVRGNPFILEDIRTLTPKLRRDHNVSVRGLKRDLTLWCDDTTGSELYLGVSSSQRGKLNNIFEGVVQSSDTGGNYVYKPFNQTHELTVRLLGGTAGSPVDHKAGDASSVTTVGLADAVRMRIVRDGGETAGTRIIKRGFTFQGPLLNNVDVLFEGITLRNDDVTQPGLERNGLFRTAGLNKFELKDVICQQTDGQGDGNIFTCKNGSINQISYREGDMTGMTKGLFGIVSGEQALIDGVITSGVTNGLSSVNPTGLTDRVV